MWYHSDRYSKQRDYILHISKEGPHLVLGSTKNATHYQYARGPPKSLKVCQFRVADDRFSYPHTTKALEPVYDIVMPGASIKNWR